ncbi:MAG TPA: hydrogenase maturation nickel metallochaperone HypA [Vicinamibacteria bacterium]
MHEYSVVQALLDQVERVAAPHAHAAVRRVVVRLGDLSGVDPVLLATAYDCFRVSTPCAEAGLEIEREPSRWECASCGRGLAPGSPLQCPSCRGPARLAAGGDIVLARVELEVP